MKFFFHKNSVPQINLDALQDLLRLNGQDKTKKKDAGIFPCCSKRVKDTIAAILIRLFMSLTIVVFIVIFTCANNSMMYLGLLAVAIVIWIETVYICIWHKSKDFYWFSLGSTLYTLICMSLFWRAAQVKYEKGDVSCRNKTSLSTDNACVFMSGLNQCEMLNYTMVDYIVTIILAKWWMPMSLKQSQKAHFNLIATLISSSADLFDLVEYADIPEITNRIGVNFIYAVAFVSLIQFSFNLSAIKDMNLKKQNRFFFIVDFLFCTEAWTIVLVCLTQDLPSLILRAFILINCGVSVQMTLYFFSVKNALLLIIEGLRVRVLYKEFKELNAQGLKISGSGLNKIQPL